MNVKNDDSYLSRKKRGGLILLLLSSLMTGGIAFFSPFTVKEDRGEERREGKMSQWRESLYREIWQEHSSQQMRGISMKAASSQLFFDKFYRPESEQLFLPRFWVQKSLYYLLPNGSRIDSLQREEEAIPMQEIYHIEAKEAIYHYVKEELTAGTVTLSLYSLPGHYLPLEEKPNQVIPHFTQEMKSLSLSLGKGEVSYVAREIRATLSSAL